MKVWAFSAGDIDASARLMTGRGHREPGHVTIVNAHDASLLARLPRFPEPFAP